MCATAINTRWCNVQFERSKACISAHTVWGLCWYNVFFTTYHILLNYVLLYCIIQCYLTLHGVIYQTVRHTKCCNICTYIRICAILNVTVHLTNHNL